MLRQSQLLGVSSGTQVLSVSSTGGFARYSSFVNHLYWRFRQVLKFCQSQVLEVSPGTQILSVTGTGGFARYSSFVSHRYWRIRQVLVLSVTGTGGLFSHCDMYATTMG